MSTPYRNDDDARTLLCEHLEYENKQLAAANAKLQAENAELKADGHRLEFIARSLAQPGQQINLVTEQCREVERANRENARTIKQFTLMLAMAFIFYEIFKTFLAL